MFVEKCVKFNFGVDFGQLVVQLVGINDIEFFNVFQLFFQYEYFIFSVFFQCSFFWLDFVFVFLDRQWGNSLDDCLQRISLDDRQMMRVNVDEKIVRNYIQDRLQRLSLDERFQWFVLDDRLQRCSLDERLFWLIYNGRL